MPLRGMRSLRQRSRRAASCRLLANRTTLLADISHNLRMPLARMWLAFEMRPRAGGGTEAVLTLPAMPA